MSVDQRGSAFKQRMAKSRKSCLPVQKQLSALELRIDECQKHKSCDHEGPLASLVLVLHVASERLPAKLFKKLFTRHDRELRSLM
jgi:hypothetical protein